MTEQFYTVLTNLGLAAFANAPVLNKQVVFSKMAVGDSKGAYYTPTKDMTGLRNKVWEGNISSISIDEANANWVIIEAIIPSDVGGFTIREVGIYDDNNNLLGIGKMPETFKPELAQGSSKDLYIKVIFEVTNATSVVLRNDPSVIIATKKYVDEQLVVKIQPLNQKIANIEESIRTTNELLKKKTEIIVTKENIPIENRKAGSFYLIETESAPVPSSQNIKVSPLMGLKKVEE